MLASLPAFLLSLFSFELVFPLFSNKVLDTTNFYHLNLLSNLSLKLARLAQAVIVYFFLSVCAHAVKISYVRKSELGNQHIMWEGDQLYCTARESATLLHYQALLHFLSSFDLKASYSVIDKYYNLQLLTVITSCSYRF